MRRKVQRATQEEINAFEQSIRSAVEPTVEESSVKAEACLCDFTWLDDTGLAALSHDALLKAAVQYRDIIMGLLDEKKIMTSAIRTMIERNNLLVTDMFGRSSEKMAVLLGYKDPASARPPADDDTRADKNKADTVKRSDSAGNASEAEAHSTDAAPESGSSQDVPDEENEGGRTWKPKRSAGCMDKQCRELPVIEKFIEMTEEELEDIFGKGNYCRKGSNDKEILEYEYIPRTLYVRKTRLCAYEAVDKEADSVKKEIAVAQNPVIRLRQCSRVTSSVWGHILDQRYSLRLPWERVASNLKKDGLALSTQMMEENARFFYGILDAVIQRMWYWLFLTEHIQIDETPVLMYDQRTKLLRKCYFWVFTVSELYDTDKPVTIFVYAAGKDTSVLRKYLVEDHTYKGYATTDGHSPYHIIEKETKGTIRNTGCLNHFRTRLARVLKAIPGLKQMTAEQLAGIPAFNALSSLQIVFRKEKETVGMSAEERAAYRTEYVLPELEKMFKDLEGLEADDFGQGSLMYTALTYRDNQQEYLKRFMEDGSLPATNSNCERRIAFFALLRNVSRFFGSDDMGAVGAGWETLAQTARGFTDHVDLYFQYLLDEAVPFIQAEDSKRGIKHTARSNLSELESNARAYFGDERLDRFMPWAQEFRDCEKKRLEERRKTARLLSTACENRS